MLYSTARNRIWFIIYVAIVINILTFHETSASNLGKDSIGDKIASDYSNFYSNDNLMHMGIGFLSMGLVANTKIDGNFQNWYQEEVRTKTTDDFSKTAKVFGDGKYLIPISLLSSGLCYFDSNSNIGNWGINSTRAYIVGAPAMLAMQRTTGGSRPHDISGSDWEPFSDDNGVSGHAFMGAVPFLTIAKMNDNKYIKYPSYLASTLTAWSRVNDNDHYLSQAILGWYMAYESVNAVFSTNNETNNISFVPIIGNDFYGIAISTIW